MVVKLTKLNFLIISLPAIRYCYFTWLNTLFNNNLKRFLLQISLKPSSTISKLANSPPVLPAKAPHRQRVQRLFRLSSPRSFVRQPFLRQIRCIFFSAPAEVESLDSNDPAGLAIWNVPAVKTAVRSLFRAFSAEIVDVDEYKWRGEGRGGGS